MINRQSAAKTLIRGFEHRYSITEKGDVYDNVRNIWLKKDDHSRYKLEGSNGKFYNIGIGKLLHSTFEKYKNFDDYEPLKSNSNYIINKQGFLYSLKRSAFIGIVTRNGYPRYNVDIRERNVHRLLAEQYIKNPNNLSTVNHIDGNKLNYGLDNLEWLSMEDNLKHAHRTGLHDYTKKSKVRRLSQLGVDSSESKK